MLLKNFMLTKMFPARPLKELGFYLSANVIKSLIPFLVLPLLTHYIPPSAYGSWSVYSALLSLLVPFTMMGLSMIVGRNYHISSRERHSETTYLAILIMLIACVGLAAIILLLGLAGDKYLGLSIPVLMTLPFLCFLQNVQFVNKIILRHEKRAKLFAALEIGNAFLTRFGGLMIVVLISANWMSLLSAQMVVNILFTAIAFWLLFKDKRIRVNRDKDLAKEIFKMGWPLMPHAIGGVILTLSDRIVLERMTDTENVGIYSLGAQLGIAVLVFCTAFNNSWGPWMNRQLHDITDDRKTRIVRYTYLYFFATILLSIATSIAGVFYILWFVESSYHAAIEVVWWTALGSCFYGMTLAINHYQIILGKTGVLPIVTGISAVVNIILSIILIHYFGMIGAAQATFISYLLLFALMMWQSQRLYPMPWIHALSFKKESSL
ncbi:MAG: oligosaccharide flippase family protein [Alphaproteobacteria bacterium]|nr:oligosaccharide flippase family protein [Alphaproteobacteria bacterium]